MGLLFFLRIFPDMFIPDQSLATGEVRNPWSAYCIDSGVTSKHFNQPVNLHPCHNMGGHQYWMLSKTGEIRQAKSLISTLQTKFNVKGEMMHVWTMLGMVTV